MWDIMGFHGIQCQFRGKLSIITQVSPEYRNTTRTNAHHIRIQSRVSDRTPLGDEFMKPFDPEVLLDCYRRGVFPMAENRDDPTIFLVDPDRRGILPLDGLHISRSMRKFVRQTDLMVTYDQNFNEVIAECAHPTIDRKETWINAGIAYLYSELFDNGHAHSVEVWRESKLVGGLYGVSIGGAFFGESMFSRETNASKLALIKLVERLNKGGYVLLDTQFITDHLASLGAIEISRVEYHEKLKVALKVKASFTP